MTIASPCASVHPSPRSLEVILNLEIYSDFSVSRHYEGGREGEGEGDGWASKMTEERGMGRRRRRRGGPRDATGRRVADSSQGYRY